jgi:tRNA(His) guanylyltransferase
MSYDNLGDRMKAYETASSVYLTRRTPVIIRLDMVAGHTFCRGFVKPYDKAFMFAMNETAIALCKVIQGCKLAYIQSDEISLLLTDWDTIKTDAWYGYRVQKVASVSAAIATREFNKYYTSYVTENHFLPVSVEFMSQEKALAYKKDHNTYYSKIGQAIFDSRCFNLPKEEVCNYFIWRQNDATRNSILGYGQSMFSHKEMQGKKCDEIQEMMFQKYQVNWNDMPTDTKRGTCAVKKDGKWIVHYEIPIFTQSRGFVENKLEVENTDGSVCRN